MALVSVTDELGKPAWWISVVIAGLVVNLASAYLKVRIDSLLSARSERWRVRSSKREGFRRSKANWLAEDDGELAGARWTACLRILVMMTAAAGPIIAGFAYLSIGVRPLALKLVLGALVLLSLTAFIAFGRMVIEDVGIIDRAVIIRRARRAPKPPSSASNVSVTE